MKHKARRAKARFERRDLKLDELKEIIERAKAAPLSAADHAALLAAVDTLAFLTLELQAQGASIERLRQLIFGARTEKTRLVFGDTLADGGDGRDGGAGSLGGGPPAQEPTEASRRPKAPGHGRNGAAAYRGAAKVKVPHSQLRCGDGCAECKKGKLYPLAEPAVLVRVTGMAPLGATLYECERLRCNLCGEVFTAAAPAGVGDQKYDETAASMIGLLKYGAGLPFNRIEKLERGLGIPLPAATQWEVVDGAATLLAPAHEALIDEAAQGEVLYNDDTTMKVLELTAESRQEAAAGAGVGANERTGVFTSGIVATWQSHRIALFFTGPKHAGENLADVLRRRAAELRAPIQMCDALSRNLPAELLTSLAHCMSHARRRFVEVVNDFPDECRYLLETLGEVYKADAIARQLGLSPEERLRLHQAKSFPRMEQLATWLGDQIDEHKVEPNSGLGEAIGYMRKHWSELTLFLRVPGAPLDNNICERALKKAILHRKNALFYKTLHGAHVGDVFMSLIHTAELNGVAPFEYLVALQRHHEHVTTSPRDWMPWNYHDALARLAHGPSPPPTAAPPR